MSRYCKYKKQKGGKVNVDFAAPRVQHGSAEQAMKAQQHQENLASEQQVKKNALLSGGAVVVPQMTQGGAEGNAAIKGALKQELQAKANAEFDNPPPLKGGRRRRRTRRKRKRRSRKSRKKRTRRKRKRKRRKSRKKRKKSRRRRSR